VDRRTEVELSEQIRREYEHGGGTIRGIAGSWGFIGAWTGKQCSVRFRLNVRDRYVRVRSSGGEGFIEAILEADRRAPRKQRHTAHRIWCRIQSGTTKRGKWPNAPFVAACASERWR